ncbi:hypothetical protein PRZ48_013982 [Zasmidium cellare]|uniref:FAD/NAD(P)-binding domain-containing protein n=1 Tax=Zasmidium cellare TaxID=395010 RepID=A0ABR0DZN0_ZASCE|nr:hypothetical protein PRZ48_013982 [Zasmidium cellare]
MVTKTANHTHPNLDVAIVGGGFAGVLALYKLRQAGFKVRGFERKGAIGGVWRENAYPGAGVDSQSPFYQFYDETILRKDDWEWSEEFSSQPEMARYFDHVDNTWDVSQNFELNAQLVNATYDEEEKYWVLRFKSGKAVSARWFLPAVGFSSVTNIPKIPGIDTFQGEIHHTALWPTKGVDLHGKRIAVLGTGPSGVQIIQAAGKMAKHMVVYQRTPPITLSKYAEPRKGFSKRSKDDQIAAFQRSTDSFSGFDYAFGPRDTFSDSPIDRSALYTERLKEGGWSFWMSCYHDMWYDRAANQEAYNFWANETKPRVTDPHKRRLLFPTEPDGPFGIKRPVLEEDFYEVLDQPNVDIVDLSDRSIDEITPTGIRVQDDLREFDVIILATGFGGDTSGLVQLDVHGRHNHALKDAWKNPKEIRSSLGLALEGFPNMFYLYGPQCPTLLVNSPAVITVQVDWVVRLLQHLRETGTKEIETRKEAEWYWKERMLGLWDQSLYRTKGRAHLTWVGGLPAYREELDSCRRNFYWGFDKM